VVQKLFGTVRVFNKPSFLGGVKILKRTYANKLATGGRKLRTACPMIRKKALPTRYAPAKRASAVVPASEAIQGARWIDNKTIIG
jgi:hypothetical protein